jgi:hypothetical protein
VLADGPLAELADDIDRRGIYPKPCCSARARRAPARTSVPDRPADYGLAIRDERNLPRVRRPASWSGATTCGVYMEQSGNRT